MTIKKKRARSQCLKCAIIWCPFDVVGVLDCSGLFANVGVVPRGVQIRPGPEKWTGPDRKCPDWEKYGPQSTFF